MREIILHVDEKGHAQDIHMAGQPDRPVNSFILLANVPADPPGMVMVVIGNSDSVGNMLMSMFQRCVNDEPQTAWVLEQVARGIVEFADAERKRWPTDGPVGLA